jgi:hypothetical protein
MDGCYLESNFRLHDYFSWLHELLRDADGSAVAGNGTPRIFGDRQKEWKSTDLDWKNPSDRKGLGNSVVLAKAAKDIRQFDV